MLQPPPHVTRGNPARARITVNTFEYFIFGEKHAKKLVRFTLKCDTLTLKTAQSHELSVIVIRGWGDRIRRTARRTVYCRVRRML